MNDGRKIHSSLQNPIDAVFYTIAHKLNPLFYKLGFTPNILTTISLIFGLLSVYYLYINNSKLSALYLLLSYLFDCFDGSFARTYGLETVFGDYYDHGTDLLVIILLVYIILKKYPHKTLKNAYIIIILLLLVLINDGCQQKIYNVYSPLASSTRVLCSNKNAINYTKYFGSGTSFLYSLYFLYTINN